MGYSGSSYPMGGNAAEEQRRSAAADEIYARLATRDFTSVFQPIISVSTGRIIGAEALSRFAGSSKPPEQWFVDAAETGLAVELDLATLEGALHAAELLPSDLYVSLNVSPATLTRHRLLTSVLASGIDPGRIVLELTEHSSILDYQPVLEALGRLRRAGLRLAIDDAGAGYASFRHILRLAPEFIKLDRSLVAGIDADPAKRALSSAVVTFGVEMHATILAEGVETVAEFHTLRGLGIDAAQGYLFGKANADWTTWSEWHASGPLLSPTGAARVH
jgi:EAL domain-containing protein (putative c-di-GMP-specific phosphodiesterase class I)